MKNNIIGFLVYFLASLTLSPSVSIILLAMKENADRCHYYGGKWSYEDLCIEPTLKSKACFRCLFITKIISG